MEEGRSAFKILVGKPKGGDQQESLGEDGRTILEWVLNKRVIGDSVQDREYWKALVNVDLNLRIP